MLLEQGYFDDIDVLYALLGKKTKTMVFFATLRHGLKDRLPSYIGANFVYEGEKEKTSASVTHHLIDIKHKGTLEAAEVGSTLKLCKGPFLIKLS